MTTNEDPGVAESGLGVGEPVTKDMSAREPTAEERESLAAAEVAMTKAEIAVRERLMERAAAFQGLGGNSGHGHVVPRPDGVKARCGGPGICAECSREAARTYSPPTTVPANPEPIPDQVLTPLSAQALAHDFVMANADARWSITEIVMFASRVADFEKAIRAPLEAICNDAIALLDAQVVGWRESGNLAQTASYESVARHLRQRLAAALAGVPKEATDGE